VGQSTSIFGFQGVAPQQATVNWPKSNNGVQANNDRAAFEPQITVKPAMTNNDPYGLPFTNLGNVSDQKQSQMPVFNIDNSGINLNTGSSAQILREEKLFSLVEKLANKVD